MIPNDNDLWNIIFGPDELLFDMSPDEIDADEDLLHVLQFFNTRATPLNMKRSKHRWTLKRRLGWA